MANISRNSYDESKHYDKVILQQGKPITDYDFNEAQDIQRGKLRRAVTELTGGGAIGEGWKIIGTGASNNFSVRAGALYSGGYRIALGSDSTANALGLTLTTPTTNRTDEVYLEVYEVEIDSIADPDIIHPKLAGIGMEPTRRIKIKADLRVAEGGSVPADTFDHFYYHLATINRLANNATITSGMVADKRVQSGIVPHKTSSPIDHPDGSVTDVKIGDRTINQGLTNPSNTGTITSLFSWLARAVKAITGKANWYDTPDITLAGTKAHIDAVSPHSGHIKTSDVVTTATANKILKLDANSKLPASITGDATTVGGKGASEFAPSTHIGAGGTSHSLATTAAHGFMSKDDKTKLGGIATGAEVNQNAFSIVRAVDAVGTSKGAAHADSKTDAVTFKEGAGIELTVNDTTDTITVAASGGGAPAVHGDQHIGADPIPIVTGSSPGLMDKSDKTKLDGIAAGAEKNQVAFSKFMVNGNAVNATEETDTFIITNGSNVGITTDVSSKKIQIGVTGKVPSAGNADTVGGKAPADFAPFAHVGSGGSAHTNASTTVAGFMSAADKTKLGGIATGAEANQNAYSNVKVGASTIASGAKTATLELASGANITLTPDITNKKVTISGNGTWPSATNAEKVGGYLASAFAENVATVSNKRAGYAVYAP